MSKTVKEKPEVSEKELRLLVYLEDCGVNKGGRINYNRLNSEEVSWLDSLKDRGLLANHGRIKSRYHSDNRLHFAELTDAALAIVAKERARRCKYWADKDRFRWVGFPDEEIA